LPRQSGCRCNATQALQKHIGQAKRPALSMVEWVPLDQTPACVWLPAILIA